MIKHESKSVLIDLGPEVVTDTYVYNIDGELVEQEKHSDM